MAIINHALTVLYKKSDSIRDFNKYEQILVSKTILKVVDAYAPYSQFKVAAGVLTNKHQISFGTNIENAVFPIGSCAERNVLAHCISNFPNEIITTLTIYGNSEKRPKNQFTSPCGMCRQAILEAEMRQNYPIKIILIKAENDLMIFESANAILPFAFTQKDL
ncbi:cytidine deaminase [Putridiphycobacter roseus]|uniref:Cytidine deaminase n=1 Tax=Putridiphycobacter roseus TaxID=2219161 RepID=A0A2W1MZN5_9FLAO|nr:cytidine deaminase [Putridiphycobacter roseus]PZE16730.1 cytidine deaminase [Putridiphycobacter roseus]